MAGLLASTQRRLSDARVEGVAGVGAVRVVTNREPQLYSVMIAPGVIDANESQLLEELILAAANNAYSKADAIKAEALGSFGGLLAGNRSR